MLSAPRVLRNRRFHLQIIAGQYYDAGALGVAATIAKGKGPRRRGVMVHEHHDDVDARIDMAVLLRVSVHRVGNDAAFLSCLSMPRGQYCLLTEYYSVCSRGVFHSRKQDVGDSHGTRGCLSSAIPLVDMYCKLVILCLATLRPTTSSLDDLHTPD